MGPTSEKVQLKRKTLFSVSITAPGLQTIEFWGYFFFFQNVAVAIPLTDSRPYCVNAGHIRQGA